MKDGMVFKRDGVMTPEKFLTIPGFRVAGLVEGVDKDRKLDIAMMVWLVRGNGRNILVDSGFYHEKFFPQWHPAEFVKPSDMLQRAGLKPEDNQSATQSWSIPLSTILGARSG